MTTRVSKLVVAAALTASLPALAAAREDCDHDGRVRPAVVAVPVAPAPPPPAVFPPPAPVRDGWRDRDGRDGWRDPRWQERQRLERERAHVRAELQELDARRAEFHARNAWRPGQLRRFDRWYFERRAELERHYAELGRVAWR